MDVNGPVGPHQNSVRIDDKNISVRPQRTLDFTLASTRHPVQHCTPGTRLDKLRYLSGLDRKIIPVDDRVRTTLINQQPTTTGAEIHISVYHDSA